MDCARVLERLADAKIHTIEKTEEFYEHEVIELDEQQHLKDNQGEGVDISQKNLIKPRGVSEWLKVQSWKGCVGVTSPWVRIPSPLPLKQIN